MKLAVCIKICRAWSSSKMELKKRISLINISGKEGLYEHEVVRNGNGSSTL